MSKHKLPYGVTYTPRNGGMYVSWDGRPEGPVRVTFTREVAFGLAEDGEFGPWQLTPFKGASGSCIRRRIIKMAAEYFK